MKKNLLVGFGVSMMVLILTIIRFYVVDFLSYAQAIIARLSFGKVVMIEAAMWCVVFGGAYVAAAKNWKRDYDLFFAAAAVGFLVWLVGLGIFERFYGNESFVYLKMFIVMGHLCAAMLCVFGARSEA